MDDHNTQEMMRQNSSSSLANLLFNSVTPLSLGSPSQALNDSFFPHAYVGPAITSSNAIYHGQSPMPQDIQAHQSQSHPMYFVPNNTAFGVQQTQMQLPFTHIAPMRNASSNEPGLGTGIDASYGISSPSQFPNIGIFDGAPVPSFVHQLRELQQQSTNSPESVPPQVIDIPQVPTVPAVQMESVYRIGKYTPAERKIRLAKYREKRAQRNYNRRVKYDCRKAIADKRRRVQGRFVTREEELALAIEQSVGAPSVPKVTNGTPYNQNSRGAASQEKPQNETKVHQPEYFESGLPLSSSEPVCDSILMISTEDGIIGEEDYFIHHVGMSHQFP